jgi:hypothetical protein
VFDDGEVKMVQGVRDIFDVIDSAEKGGATTKGKLVLIGRHLDGAVLEQSLSLALGIP